MPLEEYETSRRIIDILTRPMDGVQKAKTLHQIYSGLDKEYKTYFHFLVGQKGNGRKGGKSSAKQHPKEKAKLIIDPSAIPPPEDRALIYGLYSLPYRTIGDIEVLLGLDRKEMKELIDKYTGYGHLERRGEGGRGKKYTIETTEKGKKLLKAEQKNKAGLKNMQFIEAVGTYLGKSPAIYEGQSVSPVAVPAPPVATGLNSPKKPVTSKPETAGTDLKKAPHKKADFTYSKLSDSIRITDLEEHYFDIIHINSETGRDAYDINFCLAQAIIGESIGKSLTKKELDNMVSSAIWGSSLKERAENFVSPERGLVLIEGDEVHLSEACRNMVVEAENILFSASYGNFILNSREVQKHRTVKFPGIGEVELPPATGLKHCISSLDKRGVATEKNGNGANPNTPSEPVITIDTTNGLTIECKNNNTTRKKVLVVGNKITDAGTKIRDMIESISLRTPNQKSLIYLRKYRLIDCDNDSPALNDNGKTVYKAFSLL